MEYSESRKQFQDLIYGCHVCHWRKSKRGRERERPTTGGIRQDLFIVRSNGIFYSIRGRSSHVYLLPLFDPQTPSIRKWISNRADFYGNWVGIFQYDGIKDVQECKIKWTHEIDISIPSLILFHKRILIQFNRPRTMIMERRCSILRLNFTKRKLSRNFVIKGHWLISSIN